MLPRAIIFSLLNLLLITGCSFSQELDESEVDVNYLSRLRYQLRNEPRVPQCFIFARVVADNLRQLNLNQISEDNTTPLKNKNFEILEQVSSILKKRSASSGLTDFLDGCVKDMKSLRYENPNDSIELNELTVLEKKAQLETQSEPLKEVVKKLADELRAAKADNERLTLDLLSDGAKFKRKLKDLMDQIGHSGKGSQVQKGQSPQESDIEDLKGEVRKTIEEHKKLLEAQRKSESELIELRDRVTQLQEVEASQKVTIEEKEAKVKELEAMLQKTEKKGAVGTVKLDVKEADKKKEHPLAFLFKNDRRRS